MSPINIKMMASSVINSIHSALNVLESLPWSENIILKWKLTNLKVFVECARKLANDAQLRFDDGKVSNLASLFQRIHLALSRDPPPCNNLKLPYKEIGGWYNTLFVSLPQPTFDEVSDIIDSVLEHLNNLRPLFKNPNYYPEPYQTIEALVELIGFLRNFIRFATLRSVEPPKLLDNLLAHIQAVAVDAAHTSYIYCFHGEYDVVPNIPVVLQMIKMVDPQVDETYTQALTSSKLSTHLLSPIPDKDPDSLVVMKDFIDSLLSILCERLQTDIRIVIPTNSELQLVEEGLRLLSIMLQVQPNIFEKNFGELTRVVICDAGILIFSLYQRDMEIAIPTSGLLQRSNRITQIVKGKDFSIPDLLQRISRFRPLSDVKMMASLVLNSIRSALNDLESITGQREAIKRRLKNLEIFVVCARKLGNDAQLRFYDGKVTTLASLFQKILDVLLSRYPPPYYSSLKMLDIDNLKEEIRDWYNALLVTLPQPTLDEVTDFIDSVLQNLYYYHRDGYQTIEALIKKIRFLRNFIRFAALRSVEPPQLLDNLLAQIHAVAVDAAHTCWFYISPDYVVVPNIPVLLQMIKMVDPQVDETYTQALTSFKLSTHIISPIPDKDLDRDPSNEDSDSDPSDEDGDSDHSVIPSDEDSTSDPSVIPSDEDRDHSVIPWDEDSNSDPSVIPWDEDSYSNPSVIPWDEHSDSDPSVIPWDEDSESDPSVIMKDFIDSLLWNLWERLHMDTPIVISTNSELQLVYDGLRLLRIMLEEQPKKFDKRIGELTRVVICDAGIITFSLYQRDVEIDVPDSGLLQRINRITQIVKGKDFSIPNLLQRIGSIEQRLSDVNMMASLVLNSIPSALRRLHHSNDDYTYLMTQWKLKNLEMFVVCARKLGNNAQLRFGDGKVTTLTSLFQRINLALSRDPLTCEREIPDENLRRVIANFKEEIDGWYNTLLVSLPQPTSLDEVTHIIDSLLEHLNYLVLHIDIRYRKICYGRPHYYWSSMQPIEALIEKITFLRNFIRFATLRSIESPQLLAHIHAVAVDAAHTSYIYSFHGEYGVVPNIPVLLQMIKMVDPQVDETYTHALTSSKLSTHLISLIPDKDRGPLDEDSDYSDEESDYSVEDSDSSDEDRGSSDEDCCLSVIMKDFIDSLLWNLWERLHMDTPIVISTTSDLRLVYEGLRLLRIMLEEQPKKFDKRIEELTRVMICDAGIIIFSLYQRDMEIGVPTSGLLQRINRITQILRGKDFSILDFLQRISRIRRRVEGKDLSIPDLLQRLHGSREQVGGNYLPRTNELGFIDFVLENLLGMISSKACYSTQSLFRMIHDELSLLRSSLGKIEGARNEQKELAVKVAYRVEFLVDQLEFGDFQVSSPTSFDSTVQDILKEVKSINSKIPPATGIKVQKVSMPPNPVPFQNRAPAADEIVGFGDDITSIINRLTRGSKQLKMVAIVGMPGIGKTTLATKVFNHPSVPCRFQVRLWCCVSQLFHTKNLLLELLSLVDPDTNRNIEKSEQDLSEELRKHLKGKGYLIFLDDVWDIEAWDSLKASFPDDSCRSRILVTSRDRDAVPQAMLDEEPHFLNPLTDDQSWELLQKKLSPRNGWSLSLSDIGQQIAANCKGLPLAVVVTAGLLANMEPEDWWNVLEDLTVVANAEPCMNTFESSYKHLPGQLKECFLYFGLFPEDHKVSVKRLIRLWIAEGFVRKTESKSLEDVARDYILELARRSLVIVSQKRSRGGVKACRIHDLLHDFCRIKAKEENFFQLLKGYDELLFFEEPGYMRRLCVHSDSEVKYFESLRPSCPRLHSLLFFNHDVHRKGKFDIASIIRRYSRLRVLDTSQYLLSLSFEILSEIGLVLQLKYLSVTVPRDFLDIPSSIGNLTNLETFILHSYGKEVSLPDTFWNLQKLRHVDIKSGFHLWFENLERFPDLCELQSCSNAIIRQGESIEKLVRKFPNIRKLRCSKEYFYNSIKILTLDSLRQLESLDLTSGHRFQLVFPDNLRKLSLSKVFLQQSDVSRIGELPNLEVLKFREVSFEENTWAMEEGEFSSLKFLELKASSIVRWTASDDDQFPCLEKLVLEQCNRLEEIPCCFESINTLEIINVKYCCDSVNTFFKGIKDEQMKSGNVWTKIQISSIFR